MVTRNGKHVCFVYAVTAFGESALLRNAKPVATVRAINYCEVNVLMRNDFERVALLNPNILRYLQLYTTQRDAQLDEREHSAVAYSRGSKRTSFLPSSLRRGHATGGDGTGRGAAWTRQRGGVRQRVMIRESLNELMRRSTTRRSVSSPRTSVVAPMGTELGTTPDLPVHGDAALPETATPPPPSES